MKKKFLMILFPIIFLSAHAKIAAQKIDSSAVDASWTGEYHYSFSERGGSGYADVTEYVLTVGGVSGDSNCRFVVEGSQLNNADYECRAEGKGDRLTFYFIKSLEPAGDGQVRRMKSGDVIGSLVRVVARGKTRCRLESGRYRFAMTPTAKNPVYFKKTN